MQTRNEEVLEDDSLVISRLWSSFLPGRVCIPFGKVAFVLHLMDSTEGDH
jgi:hypothetical protein